MFVARLPAQLHILNFKTNNMAKILTTAIVADIRNKLNGSVFSKNRYGSYVRTKVTPVNPQTAAQQNARNRLATNSAAWRGLTEAQRQGWIDAAINFPVTDIYGNVKILAGNALFVQLNNNLRSIGQAPLSVAPLPVAVPQLSLVSVTASTGPDSVDLAFAPTPSPAGFSIQVRTTGNVPQGRRFVKNLYRNVAVIAAASASPEDITTDFVAVHGSPMSGFNIFVQAYLVSNTTGQAGIPVMVFGQVA